MAVVVMVDVMREITRDRLMNQPTVKAYASPGSELLLPAYTGKTGYWGDCGLVLSEHLPPLPSHLTNPDR